MGVLAIIAALVLEQWRPLSERKALAGALAAWGDWLERSFNAGESRHGTIAWLVAVLVPVAAALALYALLAWLRCCSTSPRSTSRSASASSAISSPASRARSATGRWTARES